MSRDWIDTITTLIAAGQSGRAMRDFLVDVIGLDPAEVTSRRDGAIARDAVPIATATMVREAEGLLALDLDELSGDIRTPILLLLGDHSPPWAATVTGAVGSDAGPPPGGR